MRRHLNAGYDGTGAASFSAFAARGAGVRKLLERESELAAVRSGVGRGRLLVVEGGVGLGKTAILDAASAAARRSGRLVLGARGSELERDFAFGVVRQLFEGYCAGAPDDERAALFRGPARSATGQPPTRRCVPGC